MKTSPPAYIPEDDVKYYTYVEPDYDGITPRYITLSENEILNEYWDFWYRQMCVKFGKEEVDTKYSIHECISDWVTVHWAWESNER
jgi:hypothetical protein